MNAIKQTVLKAGVSRFRAIILTTLQRLQAYPLILETSFQAHF